MAFKIESVTAFVAIDEDGEEGIMGFKNPMDGTWMPLVCADEKRVEKMYPMAEAISNISGKPYRVLQFMVRMDITDDVIKKFGK